MFSPLGAGATKNMRLTGSKKIKIKKYKETYIIFVTLSLGKIVSLYDPFGNNSYSIFTVCIILNHIYIIIIYIK